MHLYHFSDDAFMAGVPSVLMLDPPLNTIQIGLHDDHDRVDFPRA
jgi:hypothetical protein